MSAKKKAGKRQQKSGVGKFLQENPDVVICIGLALLVYLFFAPVIFTVGEFASSDAITNFSLRPYVESVERQGEFPQWIPYIFSGMPSYAALLVTGTRWWDFIAMIVFGIAKFIGQILSSDVARVSTYYAVYAVGMYLLILTKLKDRFVASFAAIAAVFSTFVIVWVMIGHNTKPAALMTYPYLLLLVEKLRTHRWGWLTAILLIGVLHVLAESSHMQLIYYAILTFALYFFTEIVIAIVRKDSIIPVGKVAVWMGIAAVFAVAMSADRYLSVREYTPYSTRGSQSILADTGKSTSSDGLDYEYATNWSFSPEEMITFLIPNYFGFGKLPYRGELTGNRTVYVHTYWGQMPFTDAANYMGIGVLLFALVGIYLYRKEPFVIFLTILSVFSLLLSFGKNFPVLYDLFFYYVPLFNKFRAPSMALVMLQFAVPILAAYGVYGMLQRIREKKNAKQVERMLRWLIGAMAGFFALGVLFALVGQEAYLEAVRNSATGKQLPAALHQFIYEQMIRDWWVTALIGVAFPVLFWLHFRQRLQWRWFIVLFLALLLFDLWRVARRPMEIPEQSLRESIFQEIDLYQIIRSDTTHFRILDLRAPSPNFPAYFFLEHIHGYSSAKMRVYQDLMDVAGQGNGNIILNPFLWSLLNMKYLIVDRELRQTFPALQPVAQSQQTRAVLYRNWAVLPYAFFVDSVAVAEPIDILHHLRDGDFDPQKLAFVEKPLPTPVLPVTETAKVQLRKRSAHQIIIETETEAPHFLFLSEIHYPPAWHARIDGKETEIYKTNYAFRGLIVPPGKHTVELYYYSSAFALGKNLSLGVNIAFFLILLVLYWYQKRRG